MKINCRKIVFCIVTLPSTWLLMQVGAVNSVWGRHLGSFLSIEQVPPMCHKLGLCWGCGTVRKKAGTKTQHGMGKAEFFPDGQMEKVVTFY